MDETQLKRLSMFVFIIGLLIVFLLSKTSPETLDPYEKLSPLDNPTRQLEGKLISQRQTAKSTTLNLEIKHRVKVVIFDKVEFPDNSELKIIGSVQPDGTIFADSIDLS